METESKVSTRTNTPAPLTSPNVGDFTDKTLGELRDSQKSIGRDTVVAHEPNEKEKAFLRKVATNPAPRLEINEIVDQTVLRLKRDLRSVPKSHIGYEDARLGIWKVIKSALKMQGREFVVDGNIKTQMPHLIKYFIGDQSGALRLQKGVYLFGDVGVGKSFTMQVFSTFTSVSGYKHRDFKTVNIKDLLFEVMRKNSLDGLSEYLEGCYCFDDLGFEDKQYKLYGNTVSVMEYLINARYNSYQKTGLVTHVVSNVPPADIEKEYGRRINSRCLEMFNFVKVTGLDKRVL